MNLRLAGNVFWNWTGMVVTMLTGFVLAPYLVHTLGDTVYGVWILIASMSGYFGLLDLGVRGSVGRYIAYYRARGDQQGVNATLNTALAILGGVAVLCLLATLAITLVFFHLFEVPPELVPSARLAILIVGCNLALTFPVSVFDGVLWGQERFDLINAVDIPTALLRMFLTFRLVQSPQDILTLAWITFATTAGNELVKVALSFRVDQKMRLGRQWFSRIHARQLYGYGIWQFLLQIARQISAQIGPLIIGGLVSVSAVTPFSVASRLIQYASQFMVAATGVLTPLATRLHARDDASREKRLFIEGGRWCAAFAWYVAILLLILGEPLLRLWMGHKVMALSMPQLVVLTLGETLAMSQWLTYSIILGKARHRAVALASLVEGVIAGLGGALVAGHWGTMGVCIVFAIAAFCCRGVFQMVQACRVLQVPLETYLRSALLRPLLAAVLPAAGLWLAVQLHYPNSWLELFAYGLLFSLGYALVDVLSLGGLVYLKWGRPEIVSLRGVEQYHG